jgi:hypothetical protein
VGDRVAHQLTWKAADDYLADALPNFIYDLPGILEIVEQSYQSSSDSPELRQVLKVLRQPELRAVFTTEEKPPTTGKMCEVCGCTLQARSRGRRPKYCGHACRQLALRRRKGQKSQEPVDLAIEVLYMLCGLEIELLRESAYRAVDEHFQGAPQSSECDPPTAPVPSRQRRTSWTLAVEPRLTADQRLLDSRHDC